MWCPLNFSIVRNSASLDPVTMAVEPKAASLLFGGLVDSLYAHKRLSSSEADDAKHNTMSF